LAKIFEKPLSGLSVFDLSPIVISKHFEDMEEVTFRPFAGNGRNIDAQPSMCQFSPQQIEISISPAHGKLSVHVIASYVISEEGECLSFILQGLIDSDYNPSVALRLNYLFADDNSLVLHLH
jgi:hypothetical protein